MHIGKKTITFVFDGKIEHDCYVCLIYMYSFMHALLLMNDAHNVSIKMYMFVCV